jgi:SAM-dependent methyltransferase
MGRLMNIVTPLHKATARNYLDRMVDDKVTCMLKAKEYEYDYWDGDRRYGYGGYKFIPGRWKPVAEALIAEYGLTAGSRVLDVGCGKAFLLHEMKQLIPSLEVTGFDISEHGRNSALDSVRGSLVTHRAQDPYPFPDKHFDLVMSLAVVHNLRIFDLERALKEMERVGTRGYLMTESYRNEQEQFNLQCWALTCESFFDFDEWVWLFNHFGYNGDYEFIYFE